MELLDSRRLTGPNRLWERPGAVIDVRLGGSDPEQLIDEWRKQARRALDAVGWSHEQLREQRYADGVSLAVSAPIDALYAATEVNDWAWEATRAVLEGHAELSLDEDAPRLRAAIEAECNPRLLALERDARGRGLAFLWDDDAVSIGLGKGSRTWPARELPEPDAVDWPACHGIPVALVTGTNGKTTSVRATASIARAAGRVAGISSTDWISVADEVIDRGDYSGPGGARTVLRDTRVEVAVLETARGGLGRRGLALESADAALITNVADDHLGDFALDDLEALADLKWVVTRAVAESGRLILNADDPLLVERGRRSALAITWFSPDPANSVLCAHVEDGGDACTVREGNLMLLSGGEARRLLPVEEIPITVGGAATYNVANCLGAVGLSAALGFSEQAIIDGLRNMRMQDNPGRGSIYEVNGARVIVDFAHNPHGVEALFEMARRLPAERRLLVMGQAGDRSDDAIRKLARAAWRMRPDRVVIKELAKYARGREKGEVAGILRDELLHLNAPAESLSYQESESDAVREALEWAREGDLLILLIHEDADGVMRSLGAPVISGDLVD